MGNPISTYDLLYKGMPEEDRARLQSEITELLKASSEEAHKTLILGVQKAATEIYSILLENPWPTVLRENGNEYGFLSSLSDHIWTLMLKSNPDRVGQYDMQKLIEAWSTHYPEQWKESVGTEAAERIKSLTERLEFQINVNRRDF